MNKNNKNAPLISRRKLLETASLLGLSMFVPNKVTAHNPDGTMPRPSGPQPLVTMLVYPRMVLLDLVGPMTIMKILGANIQLVWKDKKPVTTDVGIPITPTTTFSQCSTEPEVLFVPGGIMGTIDCMKDTEVCDFLAAYGKKAKYVTSVCTGSLILAAAGLLNGYRATSHWAVADLLPIMGAINTDARVVQDRNRITGAGVTAGIDFGLTLAALLKNEEEAKRIQLILEYAPEPPFHNGTPEQAGIERVKEARSRRIWMDAQARSASEMARHRLGIQTVG